MKVKLMLLILSTCLVMCHVEQTSRGGAHSDDQQGPAGNSARDAESTVGASINFNRDVRPILSDRCFQCHGPNEHDRQADLRLDRADGPQGAYTGQAIQPGSLDDSALWYRINAQDEDIMPPMEAGKPPLTVHEKQILKRWIEAGARYEEFWAFVPPQRPQLPVVKNRDWTWQPIDRIVMQRLESKGLPYNPRADRRTLIRRLSLDLTGLPPERDDVRAYLADRSPDSYQRLVDRLLTRPSYGEHMTKYWLDLVRFADTNGIHHDHYREMTPYRDWVIRAFNENLSYDQFIRYQLAGDLFPEPTHDQLIASGFHRLHLIIDRGTALPEESFTRNVIDRVTAVGTAFMGLTVQCAVCHDHKYDPISMKDFYQLFAFFNNLDAPPETGGRKGSDFERGLQPPYISLATKAQQREMDQWNRRIQRLKKRISRLQDELSAAGDEATSNELRGQLEQAQKAHGAVEEERRRLESTIAVAMVMKERAEIRPAHILIRGAYDNPGEQVQRDTPSFLPPRDAGNSGHKESSSRTRMDLADWLVSDENPLTARVAVNRFWQQLFGVGIVKTAEDFGAQGDWPSDPDLLDSLAISFRESGWNVKSLMRRIVLSATYQQSSEAPQAQFTADPENRRLARGSRFRMDAELIRDQLLSTSGLLQRNLYGRSVKPPQPDGLWKAVSMPSSYPRLFEPDAGEKIYRRSVYTFWKRGMPPPQMTILNAPSREACIARRERTNTPLQALLLLNEPQYLEAARHLAHQSVADRSLSPEDRLNMLYETITSHLPDLKESRMLLQLVADLETMYGQNKSLADQLCAGVTLRSGVSTEELAAWTMLVSTIYNLDITRTRS